MICISEYKKEEKLIYYFIWKLSNIRYSLKEYEINSTWIVVSKQNTPYVFSCNNRPFVAYSRPWSKTCVHTDKV